MSWSGVIYDRECTLLTACYLTSKPIIYNPVIPETITLGEAAQTLVRKLIAAKAKRGFTKTKTNLPGEV